MAASKEDNVTAMSSETDEIDGGNSSKEQVEFLPGYKTLQDFTTHGFKAVLAMTRTSNNLPDTEQWPYFSSFPSFQEAMNSQGDQVIKLMSTAMKSQGVRGNLTRRDMEEKFDLLLDANDTLLERVALNLDDVAGIRKNPETEQDARKLTNKAISGSWNQTQVSTATSQTSAAQKSLAAVSIHAKMLTTKVIEKPQLHFADKVDNTHTPFEPRIKDKPHAKKPLSIIVELTDNGEGFCHPYGYELDLFEPQEENLKEVKPKPPRPINDTPCKYIDCQDSLKNMLSDLKQYKELAVDLEYHQYRSFLGFTCLMQISTHHCDYVVDTLRLRSHLHVLNEVFANPAVLKVFHGADNDVEWLQKDLSLYLVNMFDTHIAAKLLGLPRLSLAFLVKHYCNVELDKTFQLADWRLRPLLPEMIEYARSDTHYLLYIHDRLHNQLLESGSGSHRVLKSSILQSTLLCKKVYYKPLYSDEDHLKLYRKSKKSFNNRQMWAFKELFSWRDEIARSEDESLGYVLPNHMLLQISEVLPREMQGILACCNPIPPLVRQNLGHLHRIVLRAREKPIIQTAVVEDSSSSAPKESWTKVNIESPLHCPHQLPSIDEHRTDLPTLLSSGSKRNGIINKSPLLISTPCITIMAGDDNMNGKLDVAKKVLSPYQRYMLVQPYMQHLASQAAAAEEAKTQVVEQTKPTSEELTTKQRMELIKQHFKAMDDAANAKAKESEAVVKPESADIEEIVDSDCQVISDHEDEPPMKIVKLNPALDVVPKSVRPSVKENHKAVKARKKQKQQQQQQKKPNANDGASGVTVIRSSHEASSDPFHEEADPAGMASIAEPEPFNYSAVDYSKFQGGSKQKRGGNRNQRGGKNTRGKGRQYKFPQRQNQKSFTYKSGK